MPNPRCACHACRGSTGVEAIPRRPEPPPRCPAPPPPLIDEAPLLLLLLLGPLGAAHELPPCAHAARAPPRAGRSAETTPASPCNPARARARSISSGWGGCALATQPTREWRAPRAAVLGLCGAGGAARRVGGRMGLRAARAERNNFLATGAHRSACARRDTPPTHPLQSQQQAWAMAAAAAAGAVPVAPSRGVQARSRCSAALRFAPRWGLQQHQHQHQQQVQGRALCPPPVRASADDESDGGGEAELGAAALSAAGGEEGGEFAGAVSIPRWGGHPAGACRHPHPPPPPTHADITPAAQQPGCSEEQLRAVAKLVVDRFMQDGQTVGLGTGAAVSRLAAGGAAAAAAGCPLPLPCPPVLPHS